MGCCWVVDGCSAGWHARELGLRCNTNPSPFCRRISVMDMVALCRYDVDRPKSALRAELDAAFTPDCAEFLLNELAENVKEGRKRGGPQEKKHYCHVKVAEAIKSNGDVEPHWGTGEMLKAFRADPSVLIVPDQGDVAEPSDAESPPTVEPAGAPAIAVKA